MSQELEALEKLWYHAKEDLRPNKKLYVEYLDLYMKIKQALTPPTAEEVCKALSEYLGEEVIYEGGDLHNIDRTKGVCQLNLKTKEIEIYVELPPHLITLIGCFYEGEIK